MLISVSRTRIPLTLVPSNGAGRAPNNARSGLSTLQQCFTGGVARYNGSTECFLGVEWIKEAAGGAMTRMGVALSLDCPGDGHHRNGGQSERLRPARSMV